MLSPSLLFTFSWFTPELQADKESRISKVHKQTFILFIIIFTSLRNRITGQGTVPSQDRGRFCVFGPWPFALFAVFILICIQVADMWHILKKFFKNCKRHLWPVVSFIHYTTRFFYRKGVIVHKYDKLYMLQFTKKGLWWMYAVKKRASQNKWDTLDHQIFIQIIS